MVFLHLHPQEIDWFFGFCEETNFHTCILSANFEEMSTELFGGKLNTEKEAFMRWQIGKVIDENCSDNDNNGDTCSC